MNKITKANVSLTITALAWFSLALILANSQTYGRPADKKEKNAKVVYVCACLKTKSCSCMTEAKTEGPCACGTKGGPPMKAVLPDSDWAKQNRDALAE